MYLTQGLRRSLRSTPNKLATIYLDRQQTFSQLAERVARFAGALQSSGLKTGDRVSIISHNSDHYLEMILGTFWAGGVVNPLNTRWSIKELEYAINDAQSSVLIVDTSFIEMGQKLKELAPSLSTFICDAEEVPDGMLNYQQLVQNNDPIDDTERNNDDLAFLLYTGGTTGFPKGVMLSHKNFACAAAGQQSIDCGAGDIYLHAAPMFHMADLSLLMNGLLNSSTHVMIPGFTPDGLLNAIQAHSVTDVLLVPTMIQMTLEHPDFTKFDLSSLDTIFYGAAPISQALLDKAINMLPDCGYIQGYGMTETCLTTMLSRYHHSAEGQKENRLKSAGSSTAFAEIKIADTNGNEVPNGTVGEILIKGATVMQGYWNNPEQTAKALKNGWMHTEDAAYMEDGFVYIVDRLKDMIVSGGENVYSSEVENAVMSHPEVTQCAVIGVPDEKWGETVRAVIVKTPDSTLSDDDIIAHCKTVIANYKCPRTVIFIDALPISAAGKILKTELRKL